jgi:hypothetical protein
MTHHQNRIKEPVAYEKWLVCPYYFITVVNIIAFLLASAGYLEVCWGHAEDYRYKMQGVNSSIIINNL